jgi:hypothetical protein
MSADKHQMTLAWRFCLREALPLKMWWLRNLWTGSSRVSIGGVRRLVVLLSGAIELRASKGDNHHSDHGYPFLLVGVRFVGVRNSVKKTVSGTKDGIVVSVTSHMFFFLWNSLVRVLLDVASRHEKW